MDWVAFKVFVKSFKWTITSLFTAIIVWPLLAFVAVPFSTPLESYILGLAVGIFGILVSMSTLFWEMAKEIEKTNQEIE